MYCVDALGGGEVFEYNLVRSDAHDGTVNFEKLVDNLALLEAEDVGSEPKVGDGRKPRARNVAERGEEELVSGVNHEVDR